MKIEELYSIYLRHPLISTDTRNITSGSIFFALKGDRFNANTFAAEAVRSGAACAVIDEEAYLTGKEFLLVDNVLETLQELARYHRSQLKIPVIGITGTNGKTTTKELLAAVLGTRFNTLATKGNLNNHIGVPVTVLGIGNDIEIAVIEMGANHQQEIGFLCSIAQPSHGMITNVGKAHLEGFGGFEGVKIGKGELYTWLSRSGGTVFINGTNHHLVEMLSKAPVGRTISYSGESGYVTGKLIASDPFLEIEWAGGQEKHTVTTHLTGTYNLDNILAAIAIGRYFGLEPGEINRGIENYRPNNNRSQLVKTADNLLICDYYNANPSSMAVALDNLHSLKAGHKTMVLGDMFELGDESVEEHRQLLERAMQIPADQRIFIGADFYCFSGSFPGAVFFLTTEEALAHLHRHPIKMNTVLVKGSRGMKLERLVEAL